MGKSSNPAAPSPKRSRPGSNSPGTVSLGDILESIDHKLADLVARLSLAETLHGEFRALRASLESRSRGATSAAEDETSRETAAGSPGAMTRASAGTVSADEPLVDVQPRRRGTRAVTSGNTRPAGEDAEHAAQDLTQRQVEVPEGPERNFGVHGVPTLGGGKERKPCRSRPLLPELKVNAVNSGQCKRTYAGMCA